MPNVPLMIATFAYLNQQRLTNDTMIIDVRVCTRIVFVLFTHFDPLTLKTFETFRHLKKSHTVKSRPSGGPMCPFPNFAKLLP